MSGNLAQQAETNAWIFVSHAGADLTMVRQARNYLEEKGAAPFLFHLKALTDPTEFWPLIEREIVARNFFLYCESAAAEQSEWVRRERMAVSRAREQAPKRIGRIRVDTAELDFGSLDRFLAATRVLPSYSRQDRERVEPFLEAFRTAGFQVFDDQAIQASVRWDDAARNELGAAARDGWVLVFLSTASAESEWVHGELLAARNLRARIIPVRIEPIRPPLALMDIQWFDATEDPSGAPLRLVNDLLRRTP